MSFTPFAGGVDSKSSALGLTSNTDLGPIVADGVNGTFFAPFRAEINHPLRFRDQIQVMFDHNHRLPRVD